MDQKSEGRPGSKQDIHRLEREIGRLEHALQESYSYAGKVILETAETEGRKINSLVDRIIEMRKQLVEARGDKECTACGAYNDNRFVYCGRCGEKLETNREEIAQ